MVRINKKKQEAVRKEIINKAHKMFFEDGYDQTSTSKIAKSVGIAEGTVFNYFKTKADILMAVMSEEYAKKLSFEGAVDFEIGITEIYFSYYHKTLSQLISLPKRFLLDIFMALLKLSRKTPSIIKQLAAYDFKFIDELEYITETLIKRKQLKPIDSRILAESIYAAIVYELMIYLYEPKFNEEDLNNRIYKKIEFIVSPYKEV